MIKGKNITFTYKNGIQKNILNDISFEIIKNRITVFIGKTGTGKTVLLKCITNLIKNYDGVITYEDCNVKSWTNKQRVSNIGFVFQQFNLFPHMTVLQNCTHPLKTILGLSDKNATEIARNILSSLNMILQKDLYPTQLSGGQQQKVAIARTLCLNPKVILFDEPTSSLDPESTKQLLELLLQLKEMGITLVVSSHDTPFVKGILDRTYFLDSGKIADFFDGNNNNLDTKSKISAFLNHM